MVCPCSSRPAGQIANMAAHHTMKSHAVHILVVTPVHAGLTPDSDFMTACCSYIMLQALLYMYLGLGKADCSMRRGFCTIVLDTL